VWGLYFFEEDNVTVTVTSDRIVQCWRTIFGHGDLFDGHGAENVWFQQDGTTTHTSGRSLGILREMFLGHVVSLRGDIEWPPRSSDLTPCDFFLRGYLKGQVYKHRRQTLEGLKEVITQEVAAILPEMTRRVMEKYREKLHYE
jgi:hypothetical protein